MGVTRVRFSVPLPNCPPASISMRLFSCAGVCTGVYEPIDVWCVCAPVNKAKQSSANHHLMGVVAFSCERLKRGYSCCALLSGVLFIFWRFKGESVPPFHCLISSSCFFSLDTDLTSYTNILYSVCAKLFGKGLLGTDYEIEQRFYVRSPLRTETLLTSPPQWCVRSWGSGIASFSQQVFCVRILHLGKSLRSSVYCRITASCEQQICVLISR